MGCFGRAVWRSCTAPAYICLAQCLLLLPLWSEAHLSATFSSQKNKESLLDCSDFFKPIPDHAQYFCWISIMTSYWIYSVQIEHKGKFTINRYKYLLLHTWALLSFLSTSLPLLLFFLFSLRFSLSLIHLILPFSSPSPSNHHSHPKASQEIGNLFFRTLYSLWCTFPPFSSPLLDIWW